MTQLQVLDHPGSITRKCPKCGHEQGPTTVCEACGVIFDKYWRQLEGLPLETIPAEPPPQRVDRHRLAVAKANTPRWLRVSIWVFVVFGLLNLAFSELRERIVAYAEKVAEASLDDPRFATPLHGPMEYAHPRPPRPPEPLPDWVEKILARDPAIDRIGLNSRSPAAVERRAAQLASDIQLLQMFRPQKQAEGGPPARLTRDESDRDGRLRHRIAQLQRAFDDATQRLEALRAARAGLVDPAEGEKIRRVEEFTRPSCINC